MVTTYLKLWRSSGDELDHAVISDITFRLQAVETTTQSLSTFDSQDLVQIRSNLTRDYLEFFDSCFHVGSVKKEMDYYLPNEPDLNECKMMHDFNYRTIHLGDGSGFENNAILVGRPRIKHHDVTEPGYSMKFNGSTDKVTVTQHADFNLSAFTFSFWIYPESQAGAKKILMDRGAISAWQNGAYQLYRDTTDNIVFECQNGTGTKKLVSSDIISLKGLDRWYNAIVRYDGSFLYLTVYADDETSDTDSIAQTGSFSLAADLTFGNTAKGNLDEIIFYNESLSDAEALVLHSMDSTLLHVRIKGMILWLGFNDKYFSENFHSTKTRDQSNFHTGTITTAIFDTKTPTNLAAFKPRDFISDIKAGYKFEDEKLIYIHVPETNTDLRIKDKTGAMTFDFEMLLKDCKQMNEWNQRIWEKWDHVEGENKYGYTIQVDQNNYLLVGAYWNNTIKQIKSIAPLPLDLLIRGQVVIDIDDLILGSTDTSCLQMALDGFYATSNATSDTMNLPDSIYPSTSNDLTIAKSHTERGYLCGNNMLFSFRNYSRALNDLEVLSLRTNHDTIYEIELGKLAVLDLLPLKEESPFYRKISDKVKVNKAAMELFTISSFDTVPTVRAFDSLFIPQTDTPIDIFHIGGKTTTTGYSLNLNNDWVELPVLREINDHFTLLFFIKFMGPDPDSEWGTVISGLDGMQNGNAFLMKDTRLRYTGQFEDNQENWDDYRVTIPDCTNTWISAGFTYNGDQHRFRMIYNGKIIQHWGRGGNIQHGNTKARIGRYDNGSRELSLNSKIFHLYAWRSELSQEECMEFHLTGDVTTGKSRFFQYDFVQDLLDSSEQRFNGKNHGATFSTDVPQL